MKRALLLLVPAVLLACSSAQTEDGNVTAGDTSDLTELRDFGAIESSLGLVKDPARTRPEAILGRGPCHKRMATDARPWNLRRYTKGAAFFYEDEKTAEPLSPVTCIDLDIDVGAQFPKVVALSGLSLDIALRFRLGALGNFEPPQIQHDGIEFMSFAKGWIEVLPSAAPSQPNRAEYDGHIRGLLTEMFPGKLPPDHTVPDAPQGTKLMMNVAMLAHRYAALARTFRDTDPIGFYKSVEDVSDAAVGKWKYVAKFEYATVEYRAAGGRENLTLVNVMGETLAGCDRVVAPNADYSCWNIHGAEQRWEKDAP